MIAITGGKRFKVTEIVLRKVRGGYVHDRYICGEREFSLKEVKPVYIGGKVWHSFK